MVRKGTSVLHCYILKGGPTPQPPTRQNGKPSGRTGGGEDELHDLWVSHSLFGSCSLSLSLSFTHSTSMFTSSPSTQKTHPTQPPCQHLCLENGSTRTILSFPEGEEETPEKKTPPTPSQPPSQPKENGNPNTRNNITNFA